MTSAAGRRLALVALLCCLLVTATGGVAATSSPFHSPSRSADIAPSTDFSVHAHADAPLADTETRIADSVLPPRIVQETAAGDADDNETVRHRNPDTYDEDGNEAELERWLSDWLSERLEESATEISQGEYERASEYIDDEEFEQRLEQYIEVAGDGDSGGNGSDEATAFEHARQEQRNLTDALAEYNETKTAYEEARAAGNDERARELARELEALAAEIGGSSRTVRTHYDAISETTGTDLSDGAAAVEATNETVQGEQLQIREREFVETNLTVTTTEPASISVAEPLAVTGTLRTADGEPIANERIRLNVGNQLLETETDDTGAFDVEYRPVSVPADSESVSIRYVPASASVHLASETSVAVSIEQVEPTVTVSSVDPDPVAYGDAVTVDAALTVDGQAIDDVPLSVSIAGTDLGVGSFESGTVTLEGNATVPARVPPGEQPLAITLPFEDRALASATGETTVTVAETEPDLSLTASRTGNRTATVNGTLTAAGDGLDGESVRVLADGTVLETLTTADDGSFGGSVSVPDDVANEVRFTVVYDGEGTNFARAETGTTVAFADGTSRSTVPWLVAGAIVALAVAGGGLYWYRRSSAAAADTDSDGSDESGPPIDPAPYSEPGTATHATDPNGVRALLDRASDRLADGNPDDAVRTCYAAVRRALETRLGTADTRSFTHWEFYQRYRDAEADTTVESLRTVTEAYERATFDPDGLADTDAESVLERAQDLCSTAVPSDTDSHPADD